jgi:carbon storage regulator
MLVLTRKPGEVIRLGLDITVRVLEVKGCQVRLGIDAPDRVNIVRGELHDPQREAAEKQPE